MTTTQKTVSFSWARILVWVLVLGLLALVGFFLVRAQQGPVSVGQRAPNISLTAFPGTALAGTSFNLKQAQGKIVLINFWASWCDSCLDEYDDLEQIWELYKDRGVMVVGVNWVDTEPDALGIIQRFGLTYFAGPDLGTRAGQAYRIRAVPESYLVDQRGVLAWVKYGPTTFEEMQDAIEPLLGQ
jgi:cytochrome c biogenesis protein CcmG/thiol:disulfide interchange protein DsbE